MTGLMDLFKEALIYPTKDYKALLILGVLFLVANLPSVFGIWQVEMGNAVLMILGIIAIVFYFVIMGYSLSVVKESINHNDEIPALDFVANLINGLKLFVVEIVYYIIPAIITLIIGFVSGTFSATMNIVNYVGQDLTNTTANATTIVNSVPQEYWGALFAGLAITAVCGMILFIIFGLLLEIAQCRLAKYDSIGEALNFGEVIGDIKEIGIGRYIAWYIILIIIIMVLALVIGLINAIPYIGVIIGFLICTPFITLFASRALGSLYSDAE